MFRRVANRYLQAGGNTDTINDFIGEYLFAVAEVTLKRAIALFDPKEIIGPKRTPDKVYWKIRDNQDLDIELTLSIHDLTYDFTGDSVPFVIIHGIDKNLNFRQQAAAMDSDLFALFRKLRPSGKTAAYAYADPTKDLPTYIEDLAKELLIPYPSIANVLGVNRNEVRVTVASVGNAVGSIAIISKEAEADLRIFVYADGRHKVSGVARGARLEQTFKFRPPYPGMHRGTEGDILHYIENNLPAKVIYKVYGQGSPMEFETKADLLRVYKQTGTNTMGKPILQGQPRLQGLIGPMYDGREGNNVALRYETPEINDMLSR